MEKQFFLLLLMKEIMFWEESLQYTIKLISTFMMTIQGFFGFFESIDNALVAKELLKSASD
ncbi:MAG: hypothetical protein IPG79_02435 [Saprospiraceae bacterium]|nr:hypothetical protein [Saprospiraceae bacterium]